MPPTNTVPLTALDPVQWWGLFGLKAIILVAGGALVFVFLAELSNSMDKKAPGVDSNSSGLGGGLGGWRMTPSAVWLLLSALALVLFAAFALQLSDGLIAPPPSDSARSSAKSDEKAAPSKTSETQAAPANVSDSTAGKSDATAAKKSDASGAKN